MKTLLCCFFLIPTQKTIPLQHPRDFVLYDSKIGVYGFGVRRQAELWKHERLPYYKAVLRHPYEEFYVEEDGTIILHKKYQEWGEWSKH